MGDSNHQRALHHPAGSVFHHRSPSPRPMCAGASSACVPLAGASSIGASGVLCLSCRREQRWEEGAWWLRGPCLHEHPRRQRCVMKSPCRSCPVLPCTKQICCQQTRGPPHAGAVSFAQGRATVPAPRPRQPPDGCGPRAWGGFTVMPTPETGTSRCLRGFASWVPAARGMLLAAGIAWRSPELRSASLPSPREGVCCALVLTKPVTRVKLYC